MTAADEGISGTSLKKRDQFRKLLADAGLGLFHMVVVKDVSRFARNTVDALQSIRQLKALGVNTLFLTANMDTMGDSEFVLTLFSAMAQEESANLSKRVKWGKRINAEKGRVPREIFGYDRVDNFTLRIRETEAAVVRKIFALYCDQGLGCRSISRMLNEAGERTKWGSLWNPRGVGRILNNPLYCGVLVNHKFETRDYLTGAQVALPREAQFRHDRPQWAIISPERFQQAQEIRAQRRPPEESSGRYSGRYSFSTRIRCALCGRPFTRKTYTYCATRVYWRCVTNEQYPQEHCENTVTVEEESLWQALREHIGRALGDREAFVARVLAMGGAEYSQGPDRRERLESLARKKDRYRELYAEGLLPMAALGEKLARITREEDALAAETVALPRETKQQWLGEWLDFRGWSQVDVARLVETVVVEADGRGRIRLCAAAGIRRNGAAGGGP